MTGILAAVAGATVSAPVAAVQLSSQRIRKTGYFSQTASYTISNDGKVRNGDGTILESWLLTGSASSFEVEATASGETPSGTLGSWLNCGTSQTWSLNNASGDNSDLNSTLTVSLRDTSTHTTLATATITLDAVSLNRGGV